MEEQVQEPNKDQVVDELQITTFQVPEEQVQQLGKDQVDDKLEKARHEILVGKNLEHLKIPLTHIQSATHDFSNEYRISYFSMAMLSTGQNSSIMIKRIHHPRDTTLYLSNATLLEISCMEKKSFSQK
uniref:Uncharacterized protein n=1 Tax=Helianthus annuus TaxID=4232 RepID=A0A251TE20_HELAN